MNKTGEDKMEGKVIKQNDVTIPAGSKIKDGKDPDDTVIKRGKVSSEDLSPSELGL